jgi:hypothetical protein
LLRLRFLAAGLLAAQVAAGSTSNSTSYGIHMLHAYAQTGSSASEGLFGYSYAFAFQAPEGGTLTLPGGSTIALSTTGTLNDNYLLDDGFTSLASLQSAFPSGTYTLASSGNPNLSYALGSPLFPASIPQVTNGTWQNKVLAVDPSVATTLNFSTFAEYASAGVAGHMLFSIDSLTGADNVNINQQIVSVPVGKLTVASQPFTSYTIPANTLTPGLSYLCELTFDTAASLDTTSVPGDESLLLYSNTVVFVIVANSANAAPAPTISVQPSNQTGPLGGSAVFSVGVGYGTGGQPANTTFVWFFNGQIIGIDGVKYVLDSSGGLTINGLAQSDAGSYGVAVITSGGMATSSAATLTIAQGSGLPPSITGQPASQNIASGGTVVFHVTATGATSYQWMFNGNPLSNGNGYSDVTGATLVLNGATAANAGNYACAVSNSVGTMTSSTAALTVSTTNDIGRLINISTRAQVGTGGNILIAGFVVGGQGTSGTESLLIRGSGPALAPLGVTGTLPDPQLQLYEGTNLEATNDGWGGSATISAAAAAVGAFSWNDPSSHDSALLVSEPAGAYTAQIAGESNDTGVALVEVYDDTPSGTYTPATPRLVNISARVQVGTGGNILIAGFVIGGATSKTVLVRASGPALTAFGVPGTLSDPQLQLFSATKLIASNAGWGGKAEIATAAASVGAFAWSNPSSSDSALLLTLPPGAYTAQVSGVSGDTGVALVELYEVP